ncbi:endonuclease/exonuclease/phosphatase family protein, partial [Trifolium medium]|nr:endonuclease/exonuclease/phosphatase family protein [Trifolium medium]
VIFSVTKRSKKGERTGVRQRKGEQLDTRRRKAGGLLRHSLYSLKKVARLPSKDRSEVLNVLKKNMRRRRGGNEVNRSCTGNEQVAVDDVWGIGKAIGVKFKSDNVNIQYALWREKGMCAMKIITWNTRGLGGVEKQKEVRKL